MTTLYPRKFRSSLIATGLFAAAIVMSLIAASCSSSEDATDDPTTTAAETPIASSTTDAPIDETVPSATATVEPDEDDATSEELMTTPTPPRSETEPPSSESSSEEQISLRSFDDCDALTEHILEEALVRVGPYGLDGDDGIIGPFRGGDLAIAESASVSPSADLATSAPTQGEDFSGTNVQVEGVDEADIVKTDGRRIVGISRSDSSEIWIADVASSAPKLLGRLALQDGWYREMYLAGDRVFVIGSSSVGIDPPGGGGVFENDQASSSEIAVSAIAPAWDAEAVVITEVDISDPENPEVVRHLRAEGRYVSSRATGGYARVVISSPPHKLGLVQPQYGYESSRASAERFNRLIIQESAVDQWLPDYNLHAADGESIGRGRLMECSRVFIPSEFSGFNQVSVLSFATGESLSPVDVVSTMTNGETVYASPSNLYVSHVVYDYDRDPDRGDPQTTVHKFSLDPSGSADYEGSGTAAGRPINQYAFHEYDGRLFVATTSGGWEDSESFVTVLEDDGGALQQVGKVGHLGRGEDIHAVRYIADKAYVVTFRQTDPLYVIDLSDPTNPTTEGELKITGYSAYLHPVGENLLLGVGREADETGRVTGAKMSLFDVSDPENPRTLDTLVINDGSSEVEWDARAFLWWAPEELAVVPISDWENKFTGAIALTVATDAADPEITMRTRITHDIGQQSDEDRWGYDWERQITRSMVINDDLWTLSPGYLQANSLDTLDRKAWIDIPN